MSLPVYKDFNKCALEIINDDFDYKYNLKVKAAAPHGLGVTVATDYLPKGGKASLLGKITGKWAHESGFAVDKLEMKSDGSLLTETSLTGVAPGLKFDFKGDDSSRGDISATYKHPNATATVELDVVEFSKISASILGGNGVFNAGVSAAAKLGDKAELTGIDAAASYKVNSQLFAGINTTKKFSQYNVSLKYAHCNKATLAGLFTYQPDTSASSVTLGAAYKCCPSTTIKGKVNTDGVISLSVKQTCPSKCVVVGAVEADSRDFSQVKLGATVTLG